MHHRILLGLLALALCGVPRAQATQWFPQAAREASAAPVTVTPRLRLEPLSGASEPVSSVPAASRNAYILPALASAVIPGAGEIVTGHLWNGLPLLAADIAVWFGYAHYNEEGRSLRSDYEAFAEAHWSYDLWQQRLAHPDPDNSAPPLEWYDPVNYPGGCDCSPPFIPKEQDPQEYYENAGKYVHFWPGWEDWVYNASDPVSSDSRALRAQYISMRNRSNDNFDSAGTMLGMAVLTRAVSVAQTIWLVRRDRRNTAFRLQPVYSGRRGAGMKLTWQY